MPPVRTGTASQVDGSAGNGSTSVTVPADATMAVAFWAHWDDNASETLSTLTLGGNGFTIQSQLADGAITDGSGVGVATLTNLPGTGSQTLAWTWSVSDARTEGGEIVVVWVKDHNTGTPVRDSATDHDSGTNDVSVTLDTETTDLLLAFASGAANTSLTGTVFLDNQSLNSHIYDVAEQTPSATSTTINETGATWPALAAISLPEATAAAQVLQASTDSADGNWTNETGGTTLAASIDEDTASDSDYIRSELGPQSSGCRVKLEAGGDPASSSDHVINWRIAKDTASGQTINMTVKLYQGGGNSLGGGTLIADFDRNNVSDTFTDFAETLSGGEADAITDYTDLYLEFWADVP